MKHFIDLLATEVWLSQPFFGECFTVHLGSATILSFRRVNVSFSVYSHKCDSRFSSNWFNSWIEFPSEAYHQWELCGFIYS